MTRTRWIFCGIVLLCVAILGLSEPMILGDSEAILAIVGVGSSSYALALWGISLLLNRLLFLASRKKVLLFKTSFLSWAFGFFVIVTSAVSNKIGRDWKINQAKKFVEQSSVRLEKIKAKTGRYPQHLPLNLQEPEPQILYYSSDGKSYNFRYSDGMMDGYSYDSQNHSWQPWS